MKWQACKKILCIRADNMGDVIMSTPAFRALKETFNCSLTLLTSNAGSLIARYISYVDETIVADVPWVKAGNALDANGCNTLVEKLKKYGFDAAIIFTVYSQNPLPAALIAYMANIPLRLAYCRENPYMLLTDWLPDKEPYTFIQHQVKRDLNLVKHIGADTKDEHLSISFNETVFDSADKKLNGIGFNLHGDFLIAHAGVSDTKRMYPETYWAKALKLLVQKTGIQILLTGSRDEKQLIQRIKNAAGNNVYVDGGLLSIEEFICVIANSSVVITVNTATMHIAAALHKPVVALYAQTNPQHTPWLTKNVVLYYSIPQILKSKNQVIEFVNQTTYGQQVNYPAPEEVAANALNFLTRKSVTPDTIIVNKNMQYDNDTKQTGNR